MPTTGEVPIKSLKEFDMTEMLQNKEDMKKKEINKDENGA